MKQILIICLAAFAMLAGCKTSNNETQTMNNNESLQEVAGRKNFGSNHALVTTPQPCVMIATWATIGKIDLAKLKPIVFDAAGMCYRALGDIVGQAWGSGKALAE